MTIDTAAIESLRAFAELHGGIRFAHMCTAALQGEEWAIERVRDARLQCPGMSPKRGDWHARMLHVIRSTDTTRPDGAIARRITEV